MNTKLIHHICIQTNHYQESISFYKDALGFELLSESPNFHDRDYNSWLKSGDFYIELQTGKSGERLRDVDSNTQGIVHFCLWVEDIVMEVERIKKLDVDFILKEGKEIYHVGNGRLCKIKSPEGTIVELRENRGV